MSSRTILCCWLSRRASCTCSTWTATPTRRTTWPWRRRRSSTRWRSWQGNGRKTLKLLFNPTGSQLFQKKNLLPIFCSPGSAWATLVTTVGFWKPDGANLAGGTSFGSRKTLSPSWREFDRERCFFSYRLFSNYFIGLQVMSECDISPSSNSSFLLQVMSDIGLEDNYLLQLILQYILCAPHPLDCKSRSKL